MPKRIENFAELRGRITAKGYTVRDLASSVGLSPSTLSLKLCAKAEITLSEAYDMMKLLDIPHNQMHIYFPSGGEESANNTRLSAPEPFIKLSRALKSANISYEYLAPLLGRSIEYLHECFEGQRAFSILEAYTILELLKIPNTKFSEYFPKSDLPSR